MSAQPTGVLFYEPRAKPLNTIGGIQPGAYYQFYLTNTLTPAPVFSNAALTVVLSQTPGTGGTTAASDGRLVPIYMDPGTTYRVQLYSPFGQLLEDIDPYIPVSVPSAQQIGQQLYPQTSVEQSLSITPVDYTLPEGTVNRYQINLSQGSTDMAPGIKTAVLVHAAGGNHVQFIEQIYAVASTPITLNASQERITIRGIPQKSVIYNRAPASTNPTIKLQGAQFFDIGGLVIVGFATFSNDGIQLLKDGIGNRTAFGYIHDIVCNTNGYGIEIQDTNTINIENYQYWPSGNPWGGTIDTNGQPGAIFASGVGAVNGVTLRNINIGNLNTIAVGGCGISVDGRLAPGFYQGWEVDEVECELINCRAIWFRNVNIGSISNVFTENCEVRLDSGCRGVSISGMEAASTGTLVIDGTLGGGGCLNTLITNSQGANFSSDAANIGTTQVNNIWAIAPGNADSSQNRVQINVRTTGNVLIPNSLEGAGISYGQSATAVVIGTGNTIVTNITVSRVAPAAAVTGIILASGTVPGQQVTVINESAAVNSVTFAAAGTSHVADGVSAVIAGLTQKTFIWDSSTALWYHS